MKLTWNTTATENPITVDKVNGVYLKNEYICGVNEYAPDSLLISTLRSQNLFRFNEGLTKSHEIEGTKYSNDLKNFVEPIQGFDPDTNPYMLVTGKNETWLVNVNKDNAKCRV